MTSLSNNRIDAGSTIVWLEDVNRNLTWLVGGKAAGLGELLKAGIPVPPAFCVTTTAYRDFVKESGLARQIREIISGIKFENEAEITSISNRILKLFNQSELTDKIASQILLASKQLTGRAHSDSRIESRFAVRSSAITEDLKAASFAGQHSSFLNIKEGTGLLQATKKCFASLYTPKAIVYRSRNRISQTDVAMAVIVQKMIQARVAGVMFSVHPATGNQSQIVIEGNWGLGESVVGGMVTPDEFVIDKQTLSVLSRHVASKSIEIAAKAEDNGTYSRKLQGDKARVPCLNDSELSALASLAIRIERYFGAPQDIEWVIKADLHPPENIFIVQSRPITTLPSP